MEYYLFCGLLFKMWNIIINVEKLNNFVDIYYYVEKLNNYCGGKLIYCQNFCFHVNAQKCQVVGLSGCQVAKFDSLGLGTC